MMSPDEKLIHMANQIARNFAVEGHDAAVTATATHIGKYWDPRMRARIAALLRADEASLDAIARTAVGTLRTEAD